jgi:hypothetical protein
VLQSRGIGSQAAAAVIVHCFERRNRLAEKRTQFMEGSGTAFQGADTLVGARQVVLRECLTHLVIAPACGGFGHSGGRERVL